MALDILNAKKVADNGLLSKIQIGGKVYEIKDLIARENLEALALLIDALDLNKADKEQVAKDIAAAVAGKADKDQVALDIAAAIANKADKEQVAKDIADAVKAEADIARAAEKKNADDIIAINALLNNVSDEDNITSLKELALWVEEHGGEAAEMAKSIKANADAIAAMDEAYKAADSALDARLVDVESALTGGEGSVATQIEAAKQAAIEAANKYTDEEDAKIEAEVAKKEDKANLGSLAYANTASGTVAGQTISGVKANGQSAGSINVALSESSEEITSTGNYTPSGTVTGGKVTPTGSVAITVTNADAQATLATADYQPAGEVSVTAATTEVQVVKSVGTAASFQEGAFTAATLDREDVTANYATEGLVGSVNDDECLVFTAAGIEAITATKVNSFTGGSKAADSWTANVPAQVETKTVATGIASSTFSGTVAEGLKITGVTYQKHDNATATFTGNEVDVTGAAFNGAAATIEVAGHGKAYAIDAANTKFNPAAIELAVGDIAVAAKDVTVNADAK